MMTDEFEQLRAALKQVPSPGEKARAHALQRAMENFDQLQASRHQAPPDLLRQTKDRPLMAGFFGGVRDMMKFLTAKPALLATTSAAALVIGFAIFLPVGDPLLPGKPALHETGTPGAGAAGQGAAGTGAASSAALAGAEPADPLPARKAAPAEARSDTMAAASEPATALPEASAAAQDARPPVEFSPAPAAPPLAPAADTPAPQSEAATTTLNEAGQDFYLEPRSRVATGIVPARDPLWLPRPAPVAEDYANAPANPVRIPAEDPVSTFSTDIDTASWAVIRSTLGAGQIPAPEQVRIEEMVNYFPYTYPAPEAGEAFATRVSVMPTPWNPDTRLVTIGLQGALPEIAMRPALNLVFLIDTSGSMQDMNKLPLLKQSLALMLPELRPEDQIAIVAYAGSAGTVLAPTPAGERDRILAALDSLTAGGSTAGAEGLELAYQLAAQMSGEGEVSRILLATDGDFNVGISDPEGLEAYIAKKRDQGSYLSVLGFGRGNLDDRVMQALAQNGNGTASYIDSLSEARKVLVDQLTGALFPIADDVKVQVEWNPAQVAEYRLIGYETRALAREDFRNDKVDAGEIGAGLQVTAIYEVTAPGSAGLRNEPLRYGEAAEGPESQSEELGFLRLRWKEPGESVSKLMETPITGTGSAAADDETRFAAAIAGFGQLLQGSVYTGDWGYADAIALALASRGDDPYGYRIEAVNLMRLAQSLAK